MKNLVKPHGGKSLNPLLLSGEALAAERKRAETLPRVSLSSREAGDVIMMGIGGFTPLTGFMTHADWQSVCDDMKMASGLFWPIPITLSTDGTTADSLKDNAEVALVSDGEILASMKVSEK